MGALVDVKDVFIEIAGMSAPPDTTYGSETAPLTSTLASVTDHMGHLHIPPPAVLKTWGDPFTAKGIRVHFDVGDPVAYKSRRAYPAQPLEPVALQLRGRRRLHHWRRRPERQRPESGPRR